MKEYETELRVAKEIAGEAGKIMLQYFDGDQHVEIKADNSPVTIADKLINSLAIERLSVAFPKDGVIGEEESNTEYGTGRKWFCDPIDGTAGFTWGTPTAMFSLGLIVDGVPVMGVAYDPFLDRLYEAVRNQGSFCNGIPLKVSKKKLNGGIVAVSSTPSRVMKEQSFLNDLYKKGARLASFSGAVYKSCLVARGRLVAFHGFGVSAHDVAAMHVIIEEAGGKVTGDNGETLDYTKPFKGAIVSNGIVHDEIVDSLKVKYNT